MLEKLCKNFELVVYSETKRDLGEKIMEKIESEMDFFSYQIFYEDFSNQKNIINL